MIRDSGLLFWIVLVVSCREQ